MKILIYGAGNLGQLYAARLKQAGHNVAILARGERLNEIRVSGIGLEDFQTGLQSTTRLEAISQLEPDDVYDLILVILPKHCIADVLPALAQNQCPNVMFLGNNAAGPDALIESLGKQRVLLGFPGAAAIEEGDYLRYLILSAREQPTTIGEVGVTTSDRIDEIADVFRSGGFPVSICSNMAAWLKTHAVEMVATANALYMVCDDVNKLRTSREALTLMIRAIREGYRVLSALGIPVLPASHRNFRWIPKPLLIALIQRRLADPAFAIKVGHASNARPEMQLLAEEFNDLARQTDVATPAMDALQHQAKMQTEDQTLRESA